MIRREEGAAERGGEERRSQLKEVLVRLGGGKPVKKGPSDSAEPVEPTKLREPAENGPIRMNAPAFMGISGAD